MPQKNAEKKVEHYKDQYLTDKPKEKKDGEKKSPPR